MRRSPHLDSQRRQVAIARTANAAASSSKTAENMTKVGALDLVLLVLWFGILTGLIEVAVLGVIKIGSLASAPAGWANPADRIRHSYLWLSPHVVWMAPVAMSILLGVLALLLALLGRVRPVVLSIRVMVGTLSFLCILSVLYLYPRLYDIAVVLLATGLAVQIARLVARRAARFLRIVRRTAPWLAVALVLATVGMNVGGPIRERARLAELPEPPAEAPNILLLILDTARASNMSVYGYPKETTPNLVELAAHGVAFDRAIATSPWTLPSHVSLFTGRLPYEFHTNFLIPYAGEYTTLAEYLSSRGYMTAGFVGNLVYCEYESGITRGFLHYDGYRIVPSEFLVSTALGRRIARSRTLHRWLSNYDVFGAKDAATVTSEFVRWVRRRPGHRPFFAFVNYMDAHEPYLPPQRFVERFGTKTPRRNYLNTYFLRWATRPNRQEMSADEVRAEEAAYDGTIAHVDEQIGIMLNELRTAGVMDNTIVIVVSDHGEQFGEHGLHVHGNSLFMPALHVALIVAYGDRVPAGTRVAAPVSLRDIPHTIVNLAGVPDGSPFPGESLERYWLDGEASSGQATEPIFSQLTDIRGAPTMKSLVVGRYHYIWGENRFEALFDLASDSAESQSLITRENLELVTRMRRLLAPHVRGDSALWSRLPQRD
jgi:arylsulfatase A-like enzyme